MAALLYVLTGIATAVPVVWALSWAVWGAGTSLTEYLSLFGSFILIVAGLVCLSNRRSAARVALVGAVAIWSFYLPAIMGLVKIRLTDQELGMSVLLWTPSASPLAIREPSQVPSPPNMKLSQTEIQQIKDTGITGSISTFAVNGRYGSGKKSHVTLIMQGPVTEPIELKEPDATSVVYVQNGKDWTIFPKNAPTLKRTIRIQPRPDDHNQSLVMGELATGALQGIGVWWPKVSLETPEK